MMYRRNFRLAVLAAFVFLALSWTAGAQESHRRGRKYKAPPPTSRVMITILRKDDGKPVQNASVIFHQVGDKGTMELHTDEDGKTMLDILPTGSEVLLQVIAHGYQTYGQDFKLNKSSLSIVVKLKRPVGQYSIYEGHDISVTGKKPDTQKTPDSGKSGDAKSSGKDARTEAAKQDESKPQSQ